MFYDKKVKYLDYFERGERVKGAGFVKIEARDRTLRMELSVTGLHETDSFEREVLLCTAGREEGIGKLRIAGGRGQRQWQWQNTQNIGGLGISYGELSGVSIHLGAGREISCRWQGDYRAERGGEISAGHMEKSDSQGEGEKKVSPPADSELQAAETEKKAEHESLQEERIRTAEHERRQEERIRTAEHEGLQEEQTPRHSKEVAAGHSAGERQNVTGNNGRKEEEGKGRREIRTERLMEEKWRQLWAIYPHIRPFQDDREYISLRPADFVIFPEESYKMVNNSFLLHGYYNYHHLLLTKVERRGEPCYYIGVPGNFFEKEKQVAIMFGFESFECAEEPAQAGDFGYYMMRTQL